MGSVKLTSAKMLGLTLLTTYHSIFFVAQDRRRKVFKFFFLGGGGPFLRREMGAGTEAGGEVPVCQSEQNS